MYERLPWPSFGLLLHPPSQTDDRVDDQVKNARPQSREQRIFQDQCTLYPWIKTRHDSCCMTAEKNPDHTKTSDTHHY